MNPITLFVTIVLAAAGAGLWELGVPVVGAVFVVAAVIVAASLKMANAWQKFVILRAGKLNAVKGPGLFFIVPILDSVTAVIDERIQTTGFNAERASLLVVDPYQPTPYGPSHAYWISADRVIGSILLGIVTHDANLLVVHPKPVAAPKGNVAPVHFEPL